MSKPTESSWELFRCGPWFLLLTGICFFLTVALSWLFHDLFQLREELAVGLMQIVVFLVSFAGCRNLVYRARDGQLSAQFLKFAISSVTFRGLEYLGFLVCHQVFGLQYLLAIVGVKFCAAIGKFFFYGVLVFDSGAVSASSERRQPD